jgi:hypothetical protein
MSVYADDIILYFPLGKKAWKNVYLARVMGYNQDQPKVNLKYFTYDGNVQYATNVEKSACFFSDQMDKSDLIHVQMAASHYSNCVAAHENSQTLRGAYNTLRGTLKRLSPYLSEDIHSI